MSDREILASLVGAVRAGRSASEDDNFLNGMFKQMLDPKEFRRMVYPGLSPAETAKLPQSLQDVVCDARYAADVKQLVPLAKEKAKSVLDAVKARAAKDGDVMDAATEAALYPSVFQEAFARALVSMVTATGRSAHVAEAHRAGGIASPFAPMAQWKQLHPDTLRYLLSNDTGFAVQDAFCGPGWAELYLNDLRRLHAAGRFSAQITPVSKARLGMLGMSREMIAVYKSAPAPADVVEVLTGSVCWIGRPETESEYPALFDLIERLHALPYELNGCHDLKLHEPTSRSTLISFHSEPGSVTLPSFDSGPVGTASDCGCKVSITYFLTEPSQLWEPSHGGRFGLSQPRGEVTWIDPVPDRLVVYRSRQVQKQTTPICLTGVPSPVWAVTFFVHCGDDAF